MSCRSCGAAVRFVTMAASGLSMPVDLKPHPEGTVRVFAGGTAEVLGGERLTAARSHGSLLYRSHFATCPAAGEWRRRGAAR